MVFVKYAAGLLLLVILACSPLTPVVPSAAVTVADTYEFEDGYAKYCRVTIKVENTGAVPILRSTISVDLETNEASYFRTIYDDMGVPPSTSIWLSVEFEFFSVDEQVKSESVKVSDSYFD